MALRGIALFLSSLSLADVAPADEWATVSESSTLSFSAEQQGIPFEGRFTSFTADVAFDQDHPEAGSIRGVVDTSSVETGDAMIDETLTNRQWLDPPTYPESRFETDRIERAADGAYRAHAQLTLRDVTAPVVMDFTFEEAGDNAHLSGTVRLPRLEFNVGAGTDGEWASELVVVRLELDLAR